MFIKITYDGNTINSVAGFHAEYIDDEEARQIINVDELFNENLIEIGSLCENKEPPCVLIRIK